MKKLIILLTVLIAASTLQAQNKLTIVVNGIEEQKGQLFVALYDENSFLQKPLIGKIINVEVAELSIAFDSLKLENYAVAIFHDKNGNGKLDMGAYGPTEPYAFSNNAEGVFGPPSFEACLIKVDTDTRVQIKLE